MRAKTQNQIESVPAHALLSPVDNTGILNFINFNNLGSTTLNNSAAFKKAQYSTKTTPQNLFSSADDFALKYNKIYDLYLSDMSTQDNLSYGISRQHNYTSSSSVSNGFSTQLDNKSVSKLLSYNYNYSTNPSTYTNTSSLEVTNNATPLQTNLNLVGNVTPVSSISSVNHNTDLGLGKEFATKTSLTQEGALNNSLVSVDSSSIQPLDTKLNYSNNGFDYSFFYKNFTPKSVNQQVLSGDRNIRNLNNYNPNKTNENFNNNLTTPLGNQQPLNNVATALPSASTTFPQAHIPSSALGTKFVNLGYDRFTSSGANSPLMSAKEELAPNFIFSPFWSSVYSSTNVNNRLGSALNYLNKQSNSALPSIVEYAEYDFKNWSSLESLEDLFWESSFSSYTQDEYVNILQDVTTLPGLQKQETLFNEINRLSQTKQNPLTKPFLRDLVHTTNLNSLPLFSEEAYSSTQLAPLTSFGMYDNESEFDNLDNSYDNIKFVNYIHHLNYLNTLNTYNLGVRPLSYTQVLNSFRSNYEENVLTTELFTNVNSVSGDEVSVTPNYDLRSSNPIKLRSTAKNSIVTFNALQKVFRPRFDEGRSNVRSQDLSNSYVKYPYLSESRVAYESLLGKNKESFFETNAYKTSLATTYNNLNPVFNSLNTYFSSIPFLISMQSDSVRHLWFD